MAAARPSGCLQNNSSVSEGDHNYSSSRPAVGQCSYIRSRCLVGFTCIEVPLDLRNNRAIDRFLNSENG